MLKNLVRADPIIVVDGAGEKRLTRDELPARQKKPAAKPAPKVAAPRGMPRLDDSPPRRPAPGLGRVPVPMHKPVAAPAIYRPPTEGEARNNFWTVVEKLEWRNRSDGAISREDIEGFRNRLLDRERDYFKLAFHHYQGIALDNDVVKTAAPGERTHVATHIVMMGKEMFEQYISDPTWVDFLVKNNDYQKLYDDIVDVFGIDAD